MKLVEDSSFVPWIPRGDQHPSFDAEPFERQSENIPESAATTGAKLSVVGLFAGVGGLEEGFRQAGHHSSMLCEVDAAARCVLGRHFPEAELKDDVTTLKLLPDCDVLTAGFPCQDLSQVGRRAGIAGPNSGLIETVFKLLKQQKRSPTWVVLENVPFMLTLDRGRAIRRVTSELENMGFSWAYRTIDARAFGLPQRRRRVVLLASKDRDPRPVLLGVEHGTPKSANRGNFACGFYWTEGNTGLGWAVDAVPPLKGGSALHIPSPPAIWFPKRRLVALPAIEDAERLQGFPTGWTDLADYDPRGARKRWRMVGNAVSVPMAKWIAERLSANVEPFDGDDADSLPVEGSWPRAGWCHAGKRGKSDVSEWPVYERSTHLAAFLKHRTTPLSKKAAAGFLSRLVKSCLKYDAAFRVDLEHHVASFDQG